MKRENPGAVGWVCVLTVSHSTFGITGKLLHLYFSFLICKMGLITVITLRVMVWIKWVHCVQNAQNCVWSSGSTQKLSAPTVSVSNIILSNQLTLKHSFHCEGPTWLFLKLKWFLPGNHCALCSCLFLWHLSYFSLLFWCLWHDFYPLLLPFFLGAS